MARLISVRKRATTYVFDSDARDYLDTFVVPYVSQTGPEEQADSDAFIALKSAGIFNKVLIFPHWYNNANANLGKYRAGGGVMSTAGTIDHSSDRMALTAGFVGYDILLTSIFLDPTAYGWFGWHYGAEVNIGGSDRIDFGIQISSGEAFIFGLDIDGVNSGGYTAGFAAYTSFTTPVYNTDAISVFYRNGTLQSYRKYVAGVPTVRTSRNDLAYAYVPNNTPTLGTLYTPPGIYGSGPRPWRMTGFITEAMSTTELDALATILEAWKLAKGKT